MQNKFILSLLLLINCVTTNAQSGNPVSFIQGDSIYRITKITDSVILHRAPFAIRFFCRQYDDKKEKFYSAQIAVLDNYADTSYLSVGKKTAGIPYYDAGTGIAPGENNRYDTMYISNEGHHYIYYKDESEKRADLLTKNKDLAELEWKISAANYEGKDYAFADLKLSELYFVILIDDNLNEKIDKGELKMVKVIFK